LGWYLVPGVIWEYQPFKKQVRSKPEVLFFEGQTGISVDEAYRFLQNRSLQKLMQAKRKQTDTQHDEEYTADNGSFSGSGLLKKRRLNGGARAKKQKAPTL
jgi:hypothetical protein